MKYSWILLLLLLVGCNKDDTMVVTNVKRETIVVDGQGKKYRLVKPETKNPDGTSSVELWEAIDPTNSKFYYTPTLSSKIYTNYPPLFNSILR